MWIISKNNSKLNLRHCIYISRRGGAQYEYLAKMADGSMYEVDKKYYDLVTETL